MATHDLINLGISPDSGTGDSARRGGEKINLLFSDVYTQMGDAPVGQDPTQPFYGYRRPFFENEYKVGELHPAGRYMPVKFKTDLSKTHPYDATFGHGYDALGALVDTDGDGIPDIYRDSEWYFLSRGEMIDADCREMTAGRELNLVLPLPSLGDTIRVRDVNGSWAGKPVNIWTTPYEFASATQITEWQNATGETSAPGLSAITVHNTLTDSDIVPSWHAHTSAVGGTSVTFNGSTTSPMRYLDLTRYELTFTYVGYDQGWYLSLQALDSFDLNTANIKLNHDIAAADSDNSIARALIQHNLLALDSDLNNALALQTVSQHADVAFTPLSSGDIMIYNGTNWVNSQFVDGGTF